MCIRDSIKGIELVINYEVPNDAEDYVHRIGRTARADRKGEAITFINGEQSLKFKQIEDLIERTLEKTPLPNGFEAAPAYITEKRNRGKKNFKKGHFKRNKHFKNKRKKS